MSAMAGPMFTSLTTTKNVCVVLRLGEPLSVAMTLNKLVLGPCDSSGSQVMSPPALMFAPTGVLGPRANEID